MREKPSLAFSTQRPAGNAEGCPPGGAASCGGLMREKPSLALSTQRPAGNAKGCRTGRRHIVRRFDA
jgi:hypothetical protein